MTKDPLTHALIGHAMKTHSALGPGLGEEFYHQNFVSRLLQAGIEHLSKPRRDLVYRGHVADTFEADIVIESQLVTELKALRAGFAAEHFTQLINYNKFWRIPIGLLLDFGKASLIKQRVIYTSRTATLPSVIWPGFVSNKNLAEQIFKLAASCLSDIGLGYHETTWIGLMSAAMRAEGMSFITNPNVEIPSLGRASLRCLVIENQCVVTISALGQDVSAADRATLQTYLRWLHLPWGIAFHFGREQTDLRIVSHPISKAIVPQIQEQPQIETHQESFGPGAVVPIANLQDSSWFPE
jgi:GxxExxY protein